MYDWNSFSDFMQKVENAKDRLKLHRPDQEIFFRGHRDSAYKLQPSLFRLGNKTYDEFWKLERRMFFEF